MSLQPGSTVGAYEVVSLLGQGGMGEVYRARDARLNRDVALKVLPAIFAVDASRVARFEREAQLLASLNHPGIAAIYGVEHADATPVLVLELVEGVTLADRLGTGPLALDDACRVAQQIAIALEAAHEKGIVHRDLKPANIKVTDRGQVKVLDFGLAKMLAPEGDSTPLAHSPTMSLRATQAGEILGTAAYMSPEQARGRALDRRTDVWSFGCVLFEMLTGAAPFAGPSVSDIIAAILKSEPDWSALPADTPRSIERLLKRCLVKDQALRLRDMGDAQLEIADAIGGTPAERPGVASAPASRLRVLAWPMAAAVVASLLTFVVMRTYVAAPDASSRVIYGTIPWPAIFAGGHPAFRSAISPDGRAVAFIATESAPESRLVWVRPFDTATPRPVPGTERVDSLFWSADSRSVGFYADRKLKRVAVAGGSPFTMCECFSNGGTWSREGVILFPHGDVIARLSEAGGTLTPVSVLDRDNGETSHAHPVFLPDGRHFIFLALRGQQPRGTFIGALDSTERVPLVEGAGITRFARGFVVFAKGTALMAQAFDPVKRVLVGDARPLVEQISILPDGSTAFSVTDSADVLTYGPVGGNDRRLLEWHDRTGKPLQTIGTAGNYWDVQLSKDGRYLSLSVLAIGSGSRIWIFDTLRNKGAPFTDDSSLAVRQVWSADGTRLAYMSTRNGRFDLYEKVVATGQERVLFTEGTTQKYLHDWSDDDRYLLYSEISQKGRNDLWVLPLADNAKPIAFQPSGAVEHFGQFSPDAKWIAFQSDESGALEVYVAPFPGPGRPLRVSSNGGIQPRWRSDGRELFYLSAGQLMAVDVKTADGTFDADEPKKLFDLPELSGGGGWRYDVSPGGQRFLVGREETDGPAATSLIVNWPALLRR